MPASPFACSGVPNPAAKYQLPVTFSYNGALVGPFTVPAAGALNVDFDPGQPMTMLVYLK
jgi:hypothetical protein